MKNRAFKTRLSHSSWYLLLKYLPLLFVSLLLVAGLWSVSTNFDSAFGKSNAIKSKEDRGFRNSRALKHEQTHRPEAEGAKHLEAIKDVLDDIKHEAKTQNEVQLSDSSSDSIQHANEVQFKETANENNEIGKVTDHDEDDLCTATSCGKHVKVSEPSLTDESITKTVEVSVPAVSNGLISDNSGTFNTRIMLASHSRLLWLDTVTGDVHVLHEGEGVHYGMFPGEISPEGEVLTIWNVMRPHNWHPTTSKEYLVQLNLKTGEEVSRVLIPSRFTHDTVRTGNTVYVCDTEQGQLLELAFPSMKLTRTMSLFTLKDHVNTLAPLSDGELWVVLHNLGDSDLVHLDLRTEPATEIGRIRAVGNKAHGLVLWRDFFIMLDSSRGSLIKVDPKTQEKEVLWQTPEPNKFLKGLAVVDDVAYFGVSVWTNRLARGDTTSDSEVAAFSLATRSLLWRKEVPTHGLLNIVGAPHLGWQSTYIATSSKPEAVKKLLIMQAGWDSASSSTTAHVDVTSDASGMTRQLAVSGGDTGAGVSTVAVATQEASSKQSSGDAAAVTSQEASIGTTVSSGSDSRDSTSTVVSSQTVELSSRSADSKEAVAKATDSATVSHADEVIDSAAHTTTTSSDVTISTSTDPVTSSGSSVLEHSNDQSVHADSAANGDSDGAGEFGRKHRRNKDISEAERMERRERRKALKGKHGVGDGKMDLSGMDPDMRNLVTKRSAMAEDKSKVQDIAVNSSSTLHRHEKSLLNDPLIMELNKKLDELGYPAHEGGTWSTGLPFLDLKLKNNPASSDAGIQLPLITVNVTKLKAKIEAIPLDMWEHERQAQDNAFVTGRDDNMAKFKPGVQALIVIFSDQSTDHVYRFPYYDMFKEELDELVKEIIGERDGHNIVRMQFARMKPGVEIKKHKDMGGYATRAHRIHVPIVHHPDVRFHVCPYDGSEDDGCVRIPMAEGTVFELNNRVSHYVHNDSPVNRVQLVIDVAEEPRKQMRLKPGAICAYSHAQITCPEDVKLGYLEE